MDHHYTRNTKGLIHMKEKTLTLGTQYGSVTINDELITACETILAAAQTLKLAPLEVLALLLYSDQTCPCCEETEH